MPQIAYALPVSFLLSLICFKALFPIIKMAMKAELFKIRKNPPSLYKKKSPRQYPPMVINIKISPPQNDLNAYIFFIMSNYYLQLHPFLRFHNMSLDFHFFLQSFCHRFGLIFFTMSEHDFFESFYLTNPTI